MTRQARQRMWLVVAGALCLVAGVVFLTSLFRDNMVFFLTPSECRVKTFEKDQVLRLGGVVEKGSVTHLREGQVPVVRFTVTDNAARVQVSYKGLLPDLFREGQGIVAQGTFLSRSNEPLPVFAATLVLAKHDETYRPPEKAIVDEAQKARLEHSMGGARG